MITHTTKHAGIMALLCLFFILPNPLRAQLSGTYTINSSASASSTNYKDFASAVGDMVSGTRPDSGKANGPYISGAVTFNIANGTYTEQISIPVISGASSTNTITFQSASGDSSKVILTSASSSSSTDNYTLQLFGADYITFRKISIRRTGNAQYAIVVALNNAASNNRFLNNLIIGKREASTTTTGFTGALFSDFASTGSDTNNLFQNNYVLYGTNGFYFGATASSNKVIGNIIDTTGVAGVYALAQSNFLMEGNLVRLGSFGSSVQHYVSYGIRLESSSGFKIIKNRFYNTSHATVIRAIVLFSNTSTSSNPGLIANNFVVTTGGTTSSTGISLAGNSYLNVYYNNVLNTNTVSGSSAFHVYPPTQSAGSNNNLVNNNFISKGGGYAMDISGNTSGIGISNYNNLYTNGTNIGNWNGTDYSSLSAWQSASSQDANSISVDPAYVSTFDLHVTNIAINNKGTAVTGVSDDIDNQVRSTSAPDIGADEFTPAALDAGIVLIDSPAVFCSGTKNVIVRFSNYGTSTLTSLAINWSINGVSQSAYSWTGSVTSGNSSAGIKLGSYNFAANTNYSIKVWTSSPNSSVDANAKNDTLTNTRISAMSGSYTIGGSTPNFSGFNNALVALTTRGVCGPVTFNIRDGIYTEQISVPQLASINATNTVTWQSQNGDSSKVILSYPTSVNPGVNNAVLQLNGADFHTFRKITIQRTGSLNLATVIDIKSGAHNNRFLNNRIIGLKQTSANADGNIISSPQDRDTGNWFKNNLIRNGTVSFRWNGDLSSYESGNIIEGNIIDSAYASFIETYYNNNIIIRNNMISGLPSGSSTSYGIAVSYCDGPIKITGNKIEMSSSGYAGIYQGYCSGTSSAPGLVANNFVAVAAGNVSSPYGIFQVANNYQNIYYNSVNIYGSNSTGAAYYSNSSNGGNNNLRNNNFINSGGGHAIYVGVGSYISNSDYNNLYTTGNTIGYWGTTSAANLAAWKTASSKDANSISVIPYFVSNTNLHTLNPNLNGKATPVTGITTDIDGQTRNATKPDIGADEFNLAQTDAGIASLVSPASAICIGNSSITVNLKNFGSDSLKSATITFTINDTGSTSYNWKGSLASDSIARITIATRNFSPSGYYNLKIWTRVPNNTTDQFTYNDTLRATIKVDAYPGAYTGGNKSICIGQNTVIGGAPVPGSRYSWTSDPSGFTSTSSSSFVNPTVTTTYYLTETIIATGCSKKDSLTVTVNPLPDANVGNDRSVCLGQNTVLGTTAVTGNTYSWTSIPAGFTSNVANPTVSTTVETKYILTETSATNCVKKDTVTIKINASPDAKVGTNNTVCMGEGIQLGATLVPGNSYKWTSKPAGFTSSFADPLFYPTVNTVFYLTETITGTGCSKTDSIEVTVNPLPGAFVGGNRIICAGQPVTLGNVTIPGRTYKWTSMPAGFTSSIGNPTVSPNVTTMYYLTETITATGCSKTDSVKVSVNPSPEANTGPDQTICEGTGTKIGAAPVTGNTYSWKSVPAGFTSASANPTVNPAVTTIYILTERIGSGGCARTDSVTITVSPKPNAAVLGASTACAVTPQTYKTAKASGLTYKWEVTGGTILSGQNTDSVNISWDAAATSGTLKVVVSAGGGCKDSSTTSISIRPAPSAKWSAVKVSDKTYRFMPADSTLLSYAWNFGDGGTSSVVKPTHTFPNDGSFTISLTVQNSNGCVATSDSVFITTYVGIQENLVAENNITIYPNPFKENTVIAYSLTEKARVRIQVYDIAGKEIANIADATQMPGEYKYNFNATQYNAGAGIYLVKMIIGDKFVTRQIVNLK